MSSLRNAIYRRAHKERSQPNERKKFGILEKHKDYVVRARAFHQKEETLRRLKEKAAFRNPDEFYFKMINTRTVDGVHKPESEANKYTPEEHLLMKTQDIGYILQKAQSEKKKIEKLSSVLHTVDNRPQNKHVYFAEDREEAKEIQKRSHQTREGPSSLHVPSRIRKNYRTEMSSIESTQLSFAIWVCFLEMASSYKELEARKNRVQELEKLYSHMAMQKELQKSGRKRKLQPDEIVSPTDKPVYKWRAERKR